MPSVLVIDDDACTRAVITSTFRRMGYDTFSADDGRAGLALYEAMPTDLVITDVLMPEMDGLEVIMALRGFIHIPPIIAISGGGILCGMEVLHTAKLLGADAVMPKPLSMSRLLKVAADLLDVRAKDTGRRPRAFKALRQAAA